MTLSMTQSFSCQHLSKSLCMIMLNDPFVSKSSFASAENMYKKPLLLFHYLQKDVSCCSVIDFV